MIPILKIKKATGLPIYVDDNLPSTAKDKAGKTHRVFAFRFGEVILISPQNLEILNRTKEVKNEKENACASHLSMSRGAIQHARAYLNSGLYIEPHNRNGGIVDDEFNRGAKDGAAWCSTLHLKCFEKAGSPICSDREWWSLRSVKNLRDFAYDRGCFHHILTAKPQVGDLAIYRNRGRSDVSGAKDAWHVGAVTSIQDILHFRTIDGNWNNRIARVSRSMKDHSLIGFCRFEGADFANL